MLKALRVRQSPTEGNPPAALVSPDASVGKAVIRTGSPTSFEGILHLYFCILSSRKPL
ncbi:MAG: hypothetical protein KME49_21080 [Brasilonema octagenarum HA4186-MV1]|nr:hypothetical protein [Brasilonema octagenarum HA4186-MV1]